VRPGVTVAVVSLAVALLATGARAEGEARAIVDRVAVRFFAPETGGAARPRFVTERTLAFEARLDAMTEARGTTVEAPREQHLQSALDRHVVEEMLAALDSGLGGAPAEAARLARESRADLEQRAGGEGPIGIAAEEEGIGGAEIDAIFQRRAHAAAYLDRAVTRFLHPTDEQLREVYRTSQHPFRGHAYEDVHGPLARWFVFERLKVLEAAFLQTARARVTVVVVPR
jgi:hypothetical protein